MKAHTQQKMNPAIVIVAYDRAASLTRLLKSLSKAKFNNTGDVHLIISIDGGGSKEVIKLSMEFQWSHGQKDIIEHTVNLGLKNHILKCGDLSEKYGSIILLEDDLVVSPEFFNYAENAINFFKNKKLVAGIALYSYSYSETAQLPFRAINDGFDNYFMQVPCSWGQAWTFEQWKEFRNFSTSLLTITSDDPIPEVVKNWGQNSWKKSFFKYMVLTSKFFVYPHLSLSSNCADTGTNSSNTYNHYQVQLVQKKIRPWNFADFNETISIYDAYFELIINEKSKLLFPDMIGTDTLIDTYGTKQFNLFNNKYALSSKPCKSPLISFDISLTPIISNAIYEVNGHLLHWSEKTSFNPMSPSEKLFLGSKMMPAGYMYGVKMMKNNIKFKVGTAILFPLILINKILKYITN